MGFFLLIFSTNCGFNSFSNIRDYNKTCSYITKYITKDCVKNSHNQIYMCSRGLKKAYKEEINLLNDNFIVWDFENDFCCFKEIRGN